MPQKKNPDVAELTRGKTGRLYGNLTAVMVAVKGLPLTYNRDLQEDKEPLFDSIDTIKLALDVNAEMMAAMTVNTARALEAASDPMLLATDLADYLVRRGVPFREGSRTGRKSRRHEHFHGYAPQPVERRTVRLHFRRVRNRRARRI